MIGPGGGFGGRVVLELGLDRVSRMEILPLPPLPAFLPVLLVPPLVPLPILLLPPLPVFFTKVGL